MAQIRKPDLSRVSIEWVSKYWDKNSQHNIKKNFFHQEDFYQKIIHNFFWAVDKAHMPHVTFDEILRV
jgi:hypothetical protein